MYLEVSLKGSSVILRGIVWSRAVALSRNRRLTSYPGEYSP
jgi:hypothetical protein